MPFISESITNDPLYKQSATGFSKDHILIKPLSRPNTSLGRDFEVKSCFLPANYRQLSDGIYHFDVKTDDVWILGFPSSGARPLQEIVWLLLNDFDFDKANNTPLEERTSFLEQTAVDHPKLFKSIRTSIETSRRAREPRVIKSHLPVALLPIQLWRKKPKIIYAVRNPVDVSKAYYEQYYYTHGYQGSYKSFCQLFLGDRVVNAPYLSHVTEFWRMREEENIFIQKYDEMVNDFDGFVAKIAEFLNKSVSAEQMDDLRKHFEKSVKEDIDVDAMNKFWKRKVDTPPIDVTTDDMEDYFGKWTTQMCEEYDLQLN